MVRFLKHEATGICTSESTNRGAGMERCCIAQRPASVSRVITTVETPHNTERQRERGRRGERKREEKEEEKIHWCCRQTLIIPPHHLPSRRETEHHECLILSLAKVTPWWSTSALSSFIQLAINKTQSIETRLLPVLPPRHTNGPLRLFVHLSSDFTTRIISGSREYTFFFSLGNTVWHPGHFQLLCNTFN